MTNKPLPLFEPIEVDKVTVTLFGGPADGGISFRRDTMPLGEMSLIEALNLAERIIATFR